MTEKHTDKVMSLAEANVALIEKTELYEQQQHKLAEANLALVEKTELYERQQLKLAEANLALLDKNEAIERHKLALAKANVALLEKNEALEREQARSERLLLNILPAKVAEDLKATGKTEPQRFDHATVLFSDIVNFTELAGSITPQSLIHELTEIFTAFDRVLEEHRCERIKTIGDAYLGVCGMPEADDAHVENIVQCALGMLSYIQQRNRGRKIEWLIRIGIDTGAVVGGVVGIKKYIYDVFGDTINTASRMESNSEPMRINVSAAVREALGGRYRFVARDPIDVRGKGKMLMYFLEGPEMSGPAGEGSSADDPVPPRNR